MLKVTLSELRTGKEKFMDAKLPEELPQSHIYFLQMTASYISEQVRRKFAPSNKFYKSMVVHQDNALISSNLLFLSAVM